MKATILVIDEDREMCGPLTESLGAAGYDVTWRPSVEEGVDLLQERDFGVVVSDIDVQGRTTIEICQRFKVERPDTPVILLTRFGDVTSSIDAIVAGAQDCITKPIELPMLLDAIECSLGNRHGREPSGRPRGVQVPSTELGLVVGASRAMHAIYDLVRGAAGADTTLLLSGESGTGKQLVARTLHEQGPRGSGCFVTVNCAAVPRELLASTLFGQECGAFTGGKGRRVGLLERAAEGTLLLDEIGALPLDLQDELLRVLLEGQVRPRGSSTSIPVRARIIAATRRHLAGEVAANRFRKDLFDHLDRVRIDVPPLRARGNDVLLLAEHFVRVFAARTGKAVRGIDPEAQRRLLGFDWPGNVRQLEDSMERAVARAGARRIQVEDLPERVVHFERTSRAADVDVRCALTSSSSGTRER